MILQHLCNVRLMVFGFIQFYDFQFFARSKVSAAPMAGDYVWHLAIAFAERFATGALKARFSLKDETNPGIHEEKLSLEFSFAVRELPRGCPLQRFIPLQAILKRFDCMGYRHT